jgi:hypothetical protein
VGRRLHSLSRCGTKSSALIGEILASGDRDERNMIAPFNLGMLGKEYTTWKGVEDLTVLTCQHVPEAYHWSKAMYILSNSWWIKSA